MACPDCGSPEGDFRFVTSVETHGLDCGPYETFNEEFIVCLACGGRFDLREWDGSPEEPPSFRDGRNLPERDCAIRNLPSSARPAELIQPPVGPLQARCRLPGRSPRIGTSHHSRQTVQLDITPDRRRQTPSSPCPENDRL